jgi:subtilisin family serine protease
VRVIATGLLVVVAFVGFASSVMNTSADDGYEGTETFRVPNDFYLHEQWYLFNFGQTVGGMYTGTPDADVRAPEAWSITTGSPDVVVAVIDTGVDYDHPDLSANIWINPHPNPDDHELYPNDIRGWDFVDDDNDPWDLGGTSMGAPVPVRHGTAVASVIAASGNNEIGITGLAPDVTIMPLRALGVTSTVDRDVAAAIDYAVENGAQIVNMSLATVIPMLGMSQTAEAIERAPDTLFVAAAANAGHVVDIVQTEPCSLPLPNLICVAATDEHDELAEWKEKPRGSNYGEETVHLAAPGTPIIVAAGPETVIFEESFDDGTIDRWETGGDFDTWGVDESTASSGTYSAADSPGTDYELGGESWFRLREPIDMRDHLGCRLDFSVKYDLSSSHGLFLQTSTNGGRSWPLMVGASGFSAIRSSDGEFERHTVSIDRFGAAEEFQFGFMLRTAFDSDPAAGVNIDDLQIVCFGTEHSELSYAYAEGTSFAAPLVSAAAALVMSEYPELHAEEVRAAILESVHVLPSLDGLVITSGRLDAYGALLRAGEIASADQPAVAVSSESRQRSGSPVHMGSYMEGPGLPPAYNPVPLTRGGGVPGDQAPAPDPESPDDSSVDDPPAAPSPEDAEEGEPGESAADPGDDSSPDDADVEPASAESSEDAAEADEQPEAVAEDEARDLLEQLVAAILLALLGGAAFGALIGSVLKHWYDNYHRIVEAFAGPISEVGVALLAGGIALALGGVLMGATIVGAGPAAALIALGAALAGAGAAMTGAAAMAKGLSGMTGLYGDLLSAGGHGLMGHINDAAGRGDVAQAHYDQANRSLESIRDNQDQYRSDAIGGAAAGVGNAMSRGTSNLMKGEGASQAGETFANYVGDKTGSVAESVVNSAAGQGEQAGSAPDSGTSGGGDGDQTTLHGRVVKGPDD